MSNHNTNGCQYKCKKCTCTLIIYVILETGNVMRQISQKKVTLLNLQKISSTLDLKLSKGKKTYGI